MSARRSSRRPLATGLPLLVVLALAAPPSHAQTILRVHPAAAPAGDGASWPTAYRFLQDALGAAAAIASSGQAVHVWIASGTYQPDRSEAFPAGSGDQAASFTLADNVALYGGFEGDETNLDQRDPSVHVSCLSGDLLGNDSPDPASRYENSWHVVTAEGVGPSAIIDGLTIADGYNFPPSDGSYTGSRSGAGLLIQSASPHIVCCAFTRNSLARLDSAGNAVFVDGGGPLFHDCRDCFVDGIDYDLFNNDFEAGCP